MAKVLPSASEDQQTALTKAMTELNEGTKVVAVRQKHIKIADRSKLGWGVVAAYKNDELAEDSDDEKRLFKAGRRLKGDSKRKREE